MAALLMAMPCMAMHGSAKRHAWLLMTAICMPVAGVAVPCMAALDTGSENMPSLSNEMPCTTAQRAWPFMPVACMAVYGGANE